MSVKSPQEVFQVSCFMDSLYNAMSLCIDITISEKRGGGGQICRYLYFYRGGGKNYRCIKEGWGGSFKGGGGALL